MIQTISVGDYPRIGDTAKHQVLRRALHRYDAGELNTEDVETARRNVVQQIILEQEQYLDVITDGQIYWQDPISHFFRHCHNVETGPLEIFFKTNRLYRKPIITEPIALRDHFLKQEYEIAQNYAEKPLRVVITGPYTLARHVDTADFNKTLEEITLALNQELQTLNDSPVNEIQIDEPSFSEREPLWSASAWRGYGSVLKELQNNVHHRFSLNPYWTNLAPEIESIAELPVQSIQYDLARFPFDERLLQWPGDVVLGILNAEQQRPENTEGIKKTIRQFQQKYDVLSISTNTGVRYLSRDKAIEKVKLLQEIKEELNHD